MATRWQGAKREGHTVLGTMQAGIRGILSIMTGNNDPPQSDTQTTAVGTPGRPAVLTLQSCSTAGLIKTWALWVDSAGKLRIIEVSTEPQNTDANGVQVLDPLAAIITSEAVSGTVVGSQS